MHKGLLPKNETRHRTTLIFGSSIPKRLDARKLQGKSNNKVINLAEGGATIRDVSKSMEEFYSGKHQYFSSDGALKLEELDIKKVILSIGTNDILNIRDSRNINRLFSPLDNMLRKARSLFGCQVYAQSCIPIPGQRDDTRYATYEFNRILLRLCKQHRCYYLDVFEKFLNCWRFGELFVMKSDGRIDIHPNRAGMSILARSYIAIIRDYFDPYMS